jgi:F-type H+-transporting ATPase subunit delta
VKAAKAKTAALARKLVHASIADGEPSPARVSAVLELLRRRPDRERKALLVAYLRLMRREEALRTLVIERSGALDDASRKALVDGLSQKTGRKLIVVERENPALLGGIRVRLGDDEYDASIAGKLARLAAS